MIPDMPPRTSFPPIFRRISRGKTFIGSLITLLLACCTQSATGLEFDFRAVATRSEIRLDWEFSPKQFTELGESTVFQIHALPGTSAAVGVPKLSSESLLCEAKASDKNVRFPRFNRATDLVFSRIVLQCGSFAPVVRWVTDFDDLPLRRPQDRAAGSKKGVACLQDAEDGVALGVRQLNQNIVVGSLMDLASSEPKLSFEYEGRRIGLNMKGVAALDRELLAAFHNGQRVTGILLNLIGRSTPQDSPLLHPLTPVSSVPIGPSAFNTATSEGVFYFRAMVHWLVDRYTRPDAEFGLLSGLVIGNEMQSHWSWYHLGEAEAQTVIAEYSHALRIADLAARNVHPGFRCYLSLEHHWSLSASKNPRKGFSGLEAIEGVNRLAKAEGDFPWALAFHPYPEDLFNPAFWNDRTAPFRMDAPRITFRNLEVLPAFLAQPRFLYRGAKRSIALTEQGFHCPEGERGEELQAAAYAFAWKKVMQMPEVESFLYHRHVDHPQEHGLHCGIRRYDASARHGMGPARKIHEVIRAAGTPEEERMFAFALGVIGRESWKDLLETHIESPAARGAE